MQSHTRFLAGSLMAAALFAACSNRGHTGSVQIQATYRSGLSVAEVARVEVDVFRSPSHDALSPPVHFSLANVNGAWTGLRSNVPSGSWTFYAEAFNASSVRLFHGEVPGKVTQGQTALVVINVQQDAAPGTTDNHAPQVTSLTASSIGVDYSQTVTMSATATDPDPADVPDLTFSWTATNGSFVGTTTAPSATWQAPAGPSPTSATITFTVRDPHDSTAAQSFTIQVSPQTGQGAALVTATINTWPDMDSVLINPSTVEVGGVVSLDANAHDNDNDSLTYTWDQNDCTGTFLTSNVAKQSTFQVSAQPASSPCQLRVTVTDGRGGSNTARIGLHVGPRVGSTYPPVIDIADLSDAWAFAGEPVTLTVSGHDPSTAHASITWTWVATNGTLGTPQPAVNGSTTTFSSPACSGEAFVTATATNANGGAQSTFRFDLRNCAQSCKQLKEKNPALGDGAYTIDPDGSAAGSTAPLTVFCEMTIDGGGWTFFAFQRPDYGAEAYFNGVLRTYHADRADPGSSYSIGGYTTAVLPDTEMMIALDSADPAVALTQHRLIFYKHDPTLATFNVGPYGCGGGGTFGYRMTSTGAYKQGYIGACGIPWYPYDEFGNYLVLTHGQVGGVYLGAGLGDNADQNSWNHAAWYYFR